MRRTRRFVVALLGAALLAVWAGPAAADPADEVFWRINEARVDRGLAPLSRFPSQSQAVAANDDYAQTHEPHRLHEHNWEHYAGRDATAFAENQGMGTGGFGPQRIVEAWTGSTGHAANMFSSDATHLAVAVTTASGSTVYTAHMITAPSVDASDAGPQRPAEPAPAAGEEDPGEPATEEPPTPAQEPDADGPTQADATTEPGGPAQADGPTQTDGPAQADGPTQAGPTTEPGGWRPEPIDREHLATINERDMAVVEVEGRFAERQASGALDVRPGDADTGAANSSDGDEAARGDDRDTAGADGQSGPSHDAAGMTVELERAGDTAWIAALGAPALAGLVLLVTAGGVLLAGRRRQARSRRTLRSRSRTARGRARRSARNDADATANTAAAAPTSEPIATSDGQWTRR